MKRKLLATILGVAAVPAAFGQGHVLISNYIMAPYNQVYYADLFTFPPFQPQPAVNDTSVILTVWYGEGVITDPSLLIPGVSFTVATVGGAELHDPGLGHGPGGYYLAPGFVLPTWQAGDTFTFQVRASGNSLYGPVETGLSRSLLWTENAALTSYALPSNPNTFSAGVPVYLMPEPSALAMMSLSLGTFIFFRRRKSSKS